MNIIRYTLPILLLTTINVDAQPALSNLPQEEPPVISEATKEMIRKQWEASDLASQSMAAAPKEALPQVNAARENETQAALIEAMTDNIDNQKAYIEELTKHTSELPERK